MLMASVLELRMEVQEFQEPLVLELMCSRTTEVECRTLEREVGGSILTHSLSKIHLPPKRTGNTAPSQHDRQIIYWDVMQKQNKT